MKPRIFPLFASTARGFRASSTIALTCASLLGSAALSQADVLVSESFDTDGALNGQNGGTGFSAAWSNSTDVNVAGGAVVSTGGNNPSFRTFTSAATFGNSGTLWVSFDWGHNTDTVGYGGLTLRVGGSEVAEIGDAYNGTWQVVGAGASSTSALSSMKTGVAKITLGAGATSTIELWVGPTGSPVDVSGPAMSTRSDLTLEGVDNIRVMGDSAQSFDNLIIGTTMADVDAIVTESGTWTNTAGGLWGTAGNWLDNIVATGSADFSTLNITADTTVNLDSARTVGDLFFGDTNTSSAAGWTLANNGNSGNILTLAGTTPTITVDALGSTKTATISAVVASSAGLTKSGTGTLTLSGANTYAGDTTITAGTLQIGDGGTSGTLGSGAVTIESGAVLTINRSDSYGTGGSQIFSGAGTITKEGTGDLVFNGGSDHTNVQGIDNVVVNNGLIRADYYGQWNSNLNLTANGSGKFELWSSSTSLGTLNGNGTVQNTKYYDRATTLTVAAGSFSGTITDSGITSGGPGTGDTSLSLVKSGAGTLTLSGTISYSGNTTVEDGTLSIGNGGSPTTLSDSATVSIASGATMNLNFTSSDTVGALEIAGSGPLPAGTYNSSHPTYGSYFSGTGSLVVPVTATLYELWANSFEPAIGLPAEDDDNDGVTNFEEYAFGLTPDSGASVNPIAIQLNKTNGKFSYTRRTGSGLTYSVWYSENLVGWTNDTGATEGTPVPSGDNETVEVTLSTLPGDPLPAKLFIQVRAD